MNTAMAAGIPVGIAVGIILVVIILRFINRNKKVTTEYDERQKQIRGEGYKIAFFAVLLFEAAMCAVSLLPDLPVLFAAIRHVAGLLHLPCGRALMNRRYLIYAPALKTAVINPVLRI